MLHKEGMKHMIETNEIYLGIDEHSFHGRDMVLVICDIKAKKVITVLPDNKQETLKHWLHSLSNEIKQKII